MPPRHRLLHTPAAMRLLVGWACWEKDVSSTYTEPGLNTMLITAHDDSVTLTATATEPDLSTMPISAHGNSSITTAPTSHRPTSGSGTSAVATTTRSSAGRVDFRGYELMMLGAAIVEYKCLF
ncbi:hypothetical protein QBC36DRAFT_369207 [Triangularia setosa]|uniref:Uncharacterized protein n=1 Tax=Triangularia setosa TaxID=2587417 RepID=A0AAN6VY59_9PEZI|nr:hypothetical protein QBC36DRAFT_369207 [Podospora setosa]